MYDTAFVVDVLADFLYPHLQKTEDFSAHITYCEEASKQLIKEAIGKNLERFDDDLSEQVSGSWSILDRKERTILTLAGEISYQRRIYEDTFGNSRYLLDEVLGIAPYLRCDPTDLCQVFGH